MLPRPARAFPALLSGSQGANLLPLRLRRGRDQWPGNGDMEAVGRPMRACLSYQQRQQERQPRAVRGEENGIQESAAAGRA